MAHGLGPVLAVRTLARGLQARLLARSFLLQGAWNYERMQNLGFAFCMEPWLERIEAAGGPPARRSLARHLDYFNTQPYMASFVIGVVGRLEEERAGLPEAERSAAEARIAKLKGAFGASLAGIGDALFWAVLRPFCAALAVAVWLVAWTFDSGHATGWALAAYVAAFNAPALWVRWRGLALGYAWGEAAAAELKRFGWQARIRWLRRAGLGLAAALTACAFLTPPWGLGNRWADAAVFGAALAVRSLGLPTPRIYAVTLGAALLAALAGV